MFEYATNEELAALWDAQKEEERHLITPGFMVPHLWGTLTPTFLLSKVLASKSCIIRRVDIEGNYMAKVQVMKYENGDRCGMTWVEIPPYKPIDEKRIPVVPFRHCTDLIICFQEGPEGLLINPSWKTVFRQYLWDGAVDTFMFNI